MSRPFNAGRRAAVLANATGLPMAGLCLLPAMALPAVAESGAWPLQFARSAPAPDIDAVPNTTLQIDVIARALDLARGQIQPSLGATVYQLDRQAIEKQTQGYN